MFLQIYLKKAIFLFEKTILFLKIAVIRYTRLAFCHYGKIGSHIIETILFSCSDNVRFIFNTCDFCKKKYQCFRNQQPDFKNFKDKELYYVFEGFTTLKNDELIKRLRELDTCLEQIREGSEFRKAWKIMLNPSTHNSTNEYAPHFLDVFSKIIERWGKLKPKIIDIEGNILLEV